MAEHYHVRRRHLSSTGSEEYEDEHLDPRIQVELERLNKASEEINRLELELDDARASFRQTLSESTQKLDVLAKKLGSCVEKARPYYDSRVKFKEAHLETQRAALRFERACSMHEAAKEMVQLAEQGYMRREQPSDPAWQEMLNHATMKVNEAEKERNESELEHQRTTTRFKGAEDQVQALQKDLKRSIAKSKPYFEMKAKFNQIMEEHKHKVGVLEEDVSSAKSLYSTALRSLEAISDEIHRQRLERRQQQQLGVRGSGVGAESPLPPPSWDKGHGAEGSEGNCQTLDPLGVIKVSSVPVSFSGSRRSRNLSGESSHGKEQGFVEMRPEGGAPPVDISIRDPSVSAGSSCESDVSSTMSVSLPQVKTMVSAVTSTEQPVQGVFIPADPLGVLPPIYTSSGVILHVSASGGHQSGGINHPVFAAHGLNSRTATVQAVGSDGRVTSVAHPIISHAMFAPPSSHSRGLDSGRSKSESAGPEKFVPPSAIYPNPEKARRESYRKAVEMSERASGEYALPEDLSELDDAYMPLSRTQGSRDDETVHAAPRGMSAETYRQRSYSSPMEVSQAPGMQSSSQYHYSSQSRPIPPRATIAVQEVMADGLKHGSAPEGRSGEGSPAGGSPSSRRSQKLQGLILRVDASMDPMYPSHSMAATRSTPPTIRGNPITSHNPPSKDLHVQTPSHDNMNLSNSLPRPALCSAGITSPEPKLHALPPTKPIIRSASNVSAAGSERSESEFSEVESVSANQSPTKARTRLLKVPSGVDQVEDSSDTESLASTGPMLDDEQLDFLTLDFSHALDSALDRDTDEAFGTYPMFLRRTNWSRMSLPPRLSHLENYLLQAKRLSGDLLSPEGNMPNTPTEEEREKLRDIILDLTEEGDESGALVDRFCIVNDGRDSDSELDKTLCSGTDGNSGSEGKDIGHSEVRKDDGYAEEEEADNIFIAEEKTDDITCSADEKTVSEEKEETIVVHL